MLITRVEGLYDNLNKGIKRSKTTSQSVLISQIKKIESIDPLSFFASGRVSFLGKRVFWSDPSRDFYLVGMGHEYEIDAGSHEQRFCRVKNKWHQLLDQYLINAESHPLMHGTGPVLLGGFSFDPHKPKTDLWADYSEGSMILPTFMLTVSKGQSWLTTNVIVGQDDNADEKKAWLETQEALLLKNRREASIYQNRELSKWEVKPEQWMALVAKAAKEIQDGLMEKVVLARELRIKMKQLIQVENVLIRLLDAQPLSYVFAFERNESCFIGASPELLIKSYQKDFFTTCLAGTIARGKSINEDEKLGNNLLNDKKNLHEHRIVVEMIKSAMQEGCTEVVIPELPSLYKVRDVQHLYTPIVGRVKDNVSILDMVEKLHPTPALGGHPREKALEKIRREEVLDRGWYAAPIGWMDIKGEGEFSAAIRSGLIRRKEVSIFSGCGIMGDSDPENEYQETQMKFRPMLHALGGW